MLRQQDAVHALSVDKHFFDVLPFDDVFIDQRWLSPLKFVQVCSCNDLISACQSPQLAILQVDMLEAGILKIWKSEGQKLEGVLERHLILLKPEHIV